MNEKTIWTLLLNRTGNPYGTAAIMGNLMAESSLNPLCATGKNKTANYAKDADDGAVDFENDGVAFGVAQWCYHTRKAALRELAKQREESVGKLELQLEYLWREMSEKYKSVWAAVCSAKNIREASDIVMLKYEKPGNTSETAKRKRAAYGQRFFEEYVGIRSAPEPEKKEKMVVATDNVRIRAGNGKNYGQVGSLKKGQSMVWVATVGSWHAVEMKDRVGWVSGDFSEVRT